jgi:transmembrane sensor
MDDHLFFRSLKGASSAAEHAAVQAWRLESDENERHYRELAEVLAAATRTDQKTESRPPSPLKLIHQAESVSGARGRVVRHGSPRWLRGWSQRPRWAVAAAVLVLTLAVGRHYAPGTTAVGFESEEFVTGAAEAATVTLRDGTVVRLGPRSRLRVTSGQGRDVSLRGRALFSVTPNPDKPFRIETPGGIVEVLGTRFEIETQDDDLSIAVIEGLVAVTARGNRTEVKAGEMRRVVGGATLPAVSVPKAATRDWVGNFLAFRDTPLMDAVAEIEIMYGVRFEVQDPAWARQTITAWFSDQPLEHVVTIFCMVAQATCITSPDGDVITMQYGQGQ